MHKRILLVLAVLVTPLFLISCAEHGGEGRVDPKVLAATVEQAQKTADGLDLMNTKAYGLGQLGAAMAAAGQAGAGQVLDEALSLAEDAHSEANKATLAGLKSATSGWAAADMEQVAPAIKRIEDATSRVWVISSIAEGIAKTDRSRAASILSDAATKADAVADKRYRDLDLRGVAAQLAAIDVQAAYGVAGRITDPRVKAYALTIIGSQAAGADRGEAIRVLTAAAEVAESIQRMESASELVSEETKQETKDKVAAAERARLAAASAKALSRVAAAMSLFDQAAASRMFAKAEEIASGIQTPYTRAYAMSDVAFNMAGTDPRGAVSLAEKIEKGHEDAKFAALMKAVRVNAGNSGVADQAELKNAADVAKAISDPYDRSKALSEVGLAMVSVSKEGAAEVAEEIEYTELKNEVLGALAVAWSKESDDQAKETLAKITEPRFAKRSALYAKGSAVADMAAVKAATDQAAAVKLYGKAAGFAMDAKSAQLQWKIAAGLCKLDHDKLFEMAAKIDDDNYNKAMALSEIAADWSAKGDSKAGMVWDMAAKAAAGMDDKYASGELLKTVASRCAQYDKARASAIFGMAREKVGKIGVVEG